MVDEDQNDGDWFIRNSERPQSHLPSPAAPLPAGAPLCPSGQPGNTLAEPDNPEEHCTVPVASSLGLSPSRLDEPNDNQDNDRQVSPEHGESSHGEVFPTTLVALEPSAVLPLNLYVVESNSLEPLPRSLDDMAGNSEAAQRRTLRSTAGQHSNPYRLPQTVDRGPAPTYASASNAVSALYRPRN